jgi:alpha-methylacyl-CoA racemase
VNLKHSEGIDVVKRLCVDADVFIEGYRPGVMEKIGLGPDVLLQLNSKLVYARLTGFGQSGTLAHRAGHDINYLATSGILSVSYCQQLTHGDVTLFDDFRCLEEVVTLLMRLLTW